MNWRGTRPAESLGSLDARLWVAAVVFFGFGDVLTTTVGLATSGVTEGNPVAVPLVSRYGPLVLVGLKLVAFAGGYALWRLAPRPHRIGSPLALALLGVAVTGWNIVVLTAATV